MGKRFTPKRITSGEKRQQEGWEGFSFAHSEKVRKLVVEARNWLAPDVGRSSKGWYFIMAMMRLGRGFRYLWPRDKDTKWAGLTYDEAERAAAYAAVFGDTLDLLIFERKAVKIAVIKNSVRWLNKDQRNRWDRMLAEAYSADEYAKIYAEKALMSMSQKEIEELVATVITKKVLGIEE